jgi:hypothetical protein
LTTALPRPTDLEMLPAYETEKAKRKEELTQAANMLIKQPYSFHARIQVDFELMPTSV